MVIKVRCCFPAGELLMATCNIQDQQGNWQNRIISISPLSRNVGEDRSYEISGMSMEMDDTDRYFRRMMSGGGRYISGKKVEILDETNEMIYTGTVEKWQFRENTFSLSINDRLSGLDIVIPHVISAADYPEAPETSVGQGIPLIYGRLEAPGGCIACPRVAANTFLAADHHCAELIGSVAHTEDGLPLSASLENRADGRSYIVCASDAPSLSVNIAGKTAPGGRLITDPVDALRDILNREHITLDYNETSFAEAQRIMNGRSYVIAAAITGQTSVKNFLASYCFSFDCDFYIGRSNDVVISMLDWSGLTSERDFNESKILAFQLEELPEQIRNKVKYGYHYHFAHEEFLLTPVFENAESVANWGEFYNSSEMLELKYAADDETAFDVSQRFVIQRKNPVRIASLELPLAEYSGLDIGSVISVRHPGAIDDRSRKYQIRRVETDFQTDVAQVEAWDIDAMTGGAFILGDAVLLPPSWDLADDADRMYGYLADSVTGYFGGSSDYGKVLY